jgi:release factor glutamine methyltransferase
MNPIAWPKPGSPPTRRRNREPIAPLVAEGSHIDQSPATLAELVRDAQQRIAAAGSTSARLDAEVLLRHVTQLDRVGLFTRLNEPVPDGIALAFHDLVARRIAGAPIAYLTGSREFMGMDFSVSPDVLIPRPETELLVEWALAWLSGRAGAVAIDVGTGSGAIAISLAALDTSSSNTIIASDISETALNIARANADRLLTPYRRQNTHFVPGSLLDWRDGPADLVLANLPYLTLGQIDENPDLRAEPHNALDGGRDGLDLVRALIADLPRVLAPHGAVGLELDPSQTATVTDILSATFPGATIATIHDLAGHARHVVMTLP